MQPKTKAKIKIQFNLIWVHEPQQALFYQYQTSATGLTEANDWVTASMSALSEIYKAF